MKQFLCVLLLGLVFSGFGQEKITISGYVYDVSNGESIANADIDILSLNVSTQTNVYGFYSLSVPVGTYDVFWSAKGYLNESQTIVLNENLRQDIFLFSEDNIQLQ